MSDTESITREDVERWAERNDYDADDLDNFASASFVMTGLLGKLAGDDLSDESEKEINAVHQALVEASSINEDGMVEPLEQYSPQLDMADPLGWLEE